MYRSFVVRHLEQTFERETDDVRIAYIYCNYKEPNQSSVNLIASLLQQLVQMDSHVSDEIIELYNRHIKKRTRPSLQEYSAVLQSEVRRISKNFVVIDALDECTESGGVRESLLREVKHLQPRLYLLVTTRPNISNIVYAFEDAAVLEIHAIEEDIKRYIQDRLKTEVILKNHIKKRPGLETKITATIIENVKGMSVALFSLS